MDLYDDGSKALIVLISQRQSEGLDTENSSKRARNRVNEEAWNTRVEKIEDFDIRYACGLAVTWDGWDGCVSLKAIV